MKNLIILCEYQLLICVIGGPLGHFVDLNHACSNSIIISLSFWYPLAFTTEISPYLFSILIVIANSFNPFHSNGFSHTYGYNKNGIVHFAGQNFN